jgi:hypothetical protein
VPEMVPEELEVVTRLVVESHANLQSGTRSKEPGRTLRYAIRLIPSCRFVVRSGRYRGVVTEPHLEIRCVFR